MQKSNSNNRQVQRTRSWIFEALMTLMDEKPYEKITVSDIVKKAGIARQTFYRNYNDKSDILFEYAAHSINSDLLSIKKSGDSKKQSEIVLMFNYDYIIKHQKELKKVMTTLDIEDRIFREVQEFPLSLIKHFKSKLPKEDYMICRYKICYQITGCLRVFLDWFLNDMPLPVNKLVSLLNAMNTPKESSRQDIPNIVVHISGESI